MAYPIIKIGKAKDYFEDELFLGTGEFGLLQYDEHCYLGCCAYDGSDCGEHSSFVLFREGGIPPIYVNAANEQISVLKKVNVEISVTSIDENEERGVEMDEKPEQVKPCPFCGVVPLVCGEAMEEWYISCHNAKCAVMPATDGVWDSESEAIAAWNTRQVSP